MGTIGICDETREKQKVIIPYEEIDTNFAYISKSICKIIIANEIQASGFFFKFSEDNTSCFYCLISNEHVIKQEMIDNNEIINLIYDNETIIKQIKLNNKERHIETFTDIGIDATVVEIIDNDEIEKGYFLSPELEHFSNISFFQNNQIYIPQYPLGKKITNSIGIIKKINNYEIFHTANTEEGSSGSPILLKDDIKVIGMHTGTKKNQNDNYAESNLGCFIFPIINILKESMRKMNQSKRKRVENNGNYYIGELNNEGMKNGNGKLFSSDGRIIYEGEFYNDKPEGMGKCFYNNGDYYIGPFKNGLRNGKGTIYYENGTVHYEGDFSNDQPQGNGKFILESGEYYIGQFKNGKKNGKGIDYFKNGKKQYEGDFVNDKAEGFGIFYYENGNILYIGEWKNFWMNGKGKLFYENGKIHYDGDFIADKFDGNGNLFNEEGKLKYTGQFIYGLMHGKGTLYFENGEKKYEGDFVKDEQEGHGKEFYENGNTYIGEFKKGLRHGKGLIYYNNGQIKYQGNFIRDKFEGNGKLFDRDGQMLYEGEFYNNLPINLDNELLEILK